jgi:hypothetical protein
VVLIRRLSTAAPPTNLKSPLPETPSSSSQTSVTARIKLLYFDATGLWVAAKRREKDYFSLPTPSEPNQRGIKLAPEALQHLLDGVDLREPSFKLGMNAKAEVFAVLLAYHTGDLNMTKVLPLRFPRF